MTTGDLVVDLGLGRHLAIVVSNIERAVVLLFVWKVILLLNRREQKIARLLRRNKYSIREWNHAEHQCLTFIDKSETLTSA